MIFDHFHVVQVNLHISKVIYPWTVEISLARVLIIYFDLFTTKNVTQIKQKANGMCNW